MKRKIGAILLMVALVLALAIPAAPAAAATESDPFVTDLLAGQNIDVGDVSVWNDDTNLYVKYETTGGWMMTETHLHIAMDETTIPQTTGGKNGKGTVGNPIPGHFDYGDCYDPSVTEDTFTIDLDGWAPGTPLYIAAHAVVQKETIMQEAPYYATTVDSYWQGLRKNGTPVLPGRSVPEYGLALDDPLSFFSLGFDGNIVVEFACPIRNGDGNDVQILEVTYGTTYPSETADVSASQDGVVWTPLGQADNTSQGDPGLTVSEFDLGSLSCAKYIKVEDTTNPTPHRSNADAFDLEAVVSLQDCIEIEEETAWGDGDRFTPKGNWATYFEYTVQCDLTGDWDYVGVLGTVEYPHDMTIDTQGVDGSLSGTGTNSDTWTLAGTVSGDIVSMTISYDTSSYEVYLIGTVSDCNSMSGDWESNTGQEGTWTATRA